MVDLFNQLEKNILMTLLMTIVLTGFAQLTDTHMVSANSTVKIGKKDTIYKAVLKKDAPFYYYGYKNKNKRFIFSQKILTEITHDKKWNYKTILKKGTVIKLFSGKGVETYIESKKPLIYKGKTLFAIWSTENKKVHFDKGIYPVIALNSKNEVKILKAYADK